MYKIVILHIPVNIQIVIFDIWFVYSYDFFNPTVICRIFLIALPPSKGYIGIKLNIPIKMFAYITKFLSIPNKFLFIIKNITVIMKLVSGPAKAIISFFTANIFAFFTFFRLENDVRIFI